MRLRITTLAENSVTKPGTLAEHGLSMLVEVDDFSLLLDTGASDTTVQNARALGVDLSRVSHIVLSHGHQDHTGGLKDVLAQTRGVEVVAHPEVWRARYSVRKNERVRYSGLPFLREHLEALGATFRLSEAPFAITDRIVATGHIPRRSAFERVDSNLKLRTPDGWEPDEVPDDQALGVKTPGGLVVLLGCAHCGMVNTLHRAREVSGDDRILAVLGGTHLGPAPEEQLERTVEALDQFGIEKLGVSHCTGLRAAAHLAMVFGERFFFNNVGTVTEWEL